MGYTNTYICSSPTYEETQAVIDDIELLIANSGAALTVTREPGQIVLNGARQHGAEIFKWPPSRGPSENTNYLDYPERITVYCKTCRRKYDMVVFATLLAIKHHIPEAEISTDDSIDLESATYNIRHRQYSRGCQSVVELLQKTRMNEFSPQHQRGLELYKRTFPDRADQQTIPWEPVV